MRRTVEQFYRCLRHDIRVRLNFGHNYFVLRKLRTQLKREAPERRLVAVMLLEHLGDIVTCEPIVRYLREREPNSVIIWGVKKAYRGLIDSNPHIDLTIVIHCLSERLMLSNSGLFDEVIDLHFADRHCSLCRKPLSKDQDTSNINLTNYFQYGSLLSAMSQGAGLPALDDQPMVYVPEYAVRKVDSLKLPEEFVVINCTSNAPEKGWPADKWIRLLAKIKETVGLPIFEIGTETFLDTSLSLSQSLCGKLSIVESAEVIRMASLFIGIDSGPAHLANAVGTFGVILMGSYLGFEKYNPFSGGYRTGENAEIIYKSGSVADISVDQVLQAIEKASDRIRTGMSKVV
jgi:ADP-heptose:LPS heptosyltransferase